MRALWKFLKEVALRARLWLFGIRFFEGKVPDDAVFLYRSVHELYDGSKIYFDFYRVVCIDFVLKRSQLVADGFNSYVIKANVGPEHTQAFRAFTERAWFFNARFNNFGLNEDDTLALLIDVWLDLVLVTTERQKTNVVEMT